MGKIKLRRPIHNKATRIYLIVTTCVTVILLFSGVISFERQVRAIRELSVSNIELQGERVAFEMQRRIWQLADDCLRDPLTSRVLLNANVDPGLSPSEPGEGTELAEFRARHPIVEQLFATGDHRFQYLLVVPNTRKTLDVQRRFIDTVKQQMQVGGYHVADRTYAQALRSKTDFYQVFYAVPADGGSNYLGMSVDLDWVGSSLLPQCRASVLGTGGVADQIRMELRESPPAPDDRISSRDLAVGFETVLPFWQLRLSLESLDITKTAVRREMWFVGLSVIMIVSILILEVFLFFRIFPELHIIQVRSEFISRVSHELRTPLTLIRLYAETLTEAPDLSKEEHENYCHIINRETERLTRMINNVLQFSRADRGHREMTDGDLTAVVLRTLESYERLLSRDGFTIRTALPMDIAPIRLDAEEVTQAILNLLDNARKYSLDVKLIEVAIWESSGHVTLEVADHGIGIQAEQVTRIFEPFYRSPIGTSQAGFGLGLYIVYNIMKAHGGKVEVESEPGKGSRFRLIFPVSRVPTRVHAPKDKGLLVRRGISG